jgi:hypothetical protein
MFRYTKLGESVAEIPYGVKHYGLIYLSLFDRFGPWLEDGEQHFHVGDSYLDVVSSVTTSYKTLGETEDLPTFVEVNDPILESEDHKYVIDLSNEFFHLILNTLSVILTIFRKDPKAVFVVLINNYGTVGYVCPPGQKEKNIEFLKKVFKLNNIPAYFCETEYVDNDRHTYPIYTIKNVTLVDDFSTILKLSLADITYAMETYVLDKLNLPTSRGRKLYISRNNNVIANSAFVVPGDPTSGYTTNGTRLFSESVLEDYLISEGFEIVNINLLDSIEEQVRLISSASVLLGVTGTGLTNCLFLNSGSMVIELKVEILWPSGDHDANDHYFKLSYGKGHYYVSLDVSDKQGATAVNKLKILFKALNINNL